MDNCFTGSLIRGWSRRNAALLYPPRGKRQRAGKLPRTAPPLPLGGRGSGRRLPVCFRDPSLDSSSSPTFSRPGENLRPERPGVVASQPVVTLPVPSSEGPLNQRDSWSQQAHHTIPRTVPHRLGKIPVISEGVGYAMFSCLRRPLRPGGQ